MAHKNYHLGAVALLFVTASLHAQSPQDAGTLLREQQTRPAPGPAQRGSVTTVPDTRDSKPAAPEGRLTVRQFRLEQNTRYGQSELSAVLAPLTGKPLTFSQLAAALTAIQDYYRQGGFLARAFFPPQDVDNGVVRITVVEARVGAITAEGSGQGNAIDFIKSRVGAGDFLNVDALSAAVTILNEQNGVQARARLAPGKAAAETDIEMHIEESTRNSGLIEDNNFGSRATGRFQTNVGVSATNPFGVYDQLSVRGTLNGGGIRFVRVDYSRPLGTQGLRAGLNMSTLDYRITQAAFAALGSEGRASTWGGILSYPLVRRDQLSVSTYLSGDSKLLNDTSLGVSQKNARIRLGTLGFTASLADAMGSGNTDLAISVGHGTLNLADPTLDARDTRGSFSKLGWSIQRQQTLNKEFALSASVLGQWAGKNLDSAERIALGGPYGIRAYPVGEGIGDEALMFKLSLTHPISARLGASLFVEGGRVTLNKNLYTGWNGANPNLPNRYSLAGAGAGLDYQMGKFAVSAVLAAKIGNNPGRDTNGNDTDGSHSRMRGWLTARYAF